MKRFWQSINYLGGWNDTRYLQKKVATDNGEWVMIHNREVMPLCVLKEVRSKYPNPQGIPYLGHKWQ
jgi:hypothetical protein